MPASPLSALAPPFLPAIFGLLLAMACSSSSPAVGDGSSSPADAAAADGAQPERPSDGADGCGLRPGVLDGSTRPTSVGTVNLSGNGAFHAVYFSGGVSRSETGQRDAYVVALHLTDNLVPLSCAVECPREAGHVISLVVADRMQRPVGPGQYPREGFLSLVAYVERSAGGASHSREPILRRLTLDVVEQDHLRGSFELLFGDGPSAEPLTGTFDAMDDPCWTPPIIHPGM